MQPEPYQPSWRKPVGMFLILFLIIGWTVGVVTLVDALGLPALAQAPIYLFAGIIWLWLFPMKRLLAWMELGPRRD